MHVDVAALSPQDKYKILTNLVVPRPIAWVTSQDVQGRLNLAPFSFFNAVGSTPPMVMVSVVDQDGGLKHTAQNIAATREFVVNLVTEELIDAMNISGADFPARISELEAAKLETAASVKIRTPRVARAQAALECTLHSVQRIGSNSVIFGEVHVYHIADELVGERYHINNFAPIGRLGSPSMYCRTNDRFDLPRMTYAQWKEKHSAL